MIRIASWNVNSVNARIGNIINWLRNSPVDVLLMQEIKTEEEKFPFNDFKMEGFYCTVNGQKSYNGVAIISKIPFKQEIKQLPNLDNDEQARYIEVLLDNNLRVASVYVPNGNPSNNDWSDKSKFEYKLKWLDGLYIHAKNLLKDKKPFLIGGDYNVILEDKDVYDIEAFRGNALTRNEVKERFRALTYLGLTNCHKELNKNNSGYSFWDYQGGAWAKDEGMLIDHILLSPQCADRLIKTGIDKEVRGQEKASDHVPIWCELDY